MSSFSRSQTLFGLVIFSLLVSGVAGFAFPAKAVVAFNTFPISYTSQTNYDLPMIDARDITTGGSYSVSQADHDNGVPANAGDLVGFVIYYHNSGVAEDVATNVTIRAALPGGTRVDHEVSATISSDQTAPVSSSDPARGGNIVIHISGGAQTLTFVPGSVRWFPNRATTGQTLANGDSLVTSGVNIGSVQGCFQFSGFITFQAWVGSQVTNQGLTISKAVLNVTQGQSSFQSSTNANPGDRVRFQVQIGTTGNTQQTNVTLTDNLPSLLSFAGGLLKDGVPITGGDGGLFGNGINFGTQGPGASHTVVFEATVAGSGSFTGNVTLTNTAAVRSDQVGNQQASANVNVQVSQQIQNLAINKTVMDVSTGGSFQKSISANPGDRVRFQIVVNTSGNTQQTNVVVRDSLPANLTYISGTETLNGSGVSNETDLFNNGKNLGTLAANVTQTLVFDAFVAGSGAFSGNTTLTNFANVRSDQVGQVQDSASIFVQTIPGTQSLSIVKTVMDVSTGGSFQKSISANPGDRVRFQIVVNTSGNTQQTNVVVRDSLPANLNYISGTETLNGSSVGSEMDLFNNGKNLGTLAANVTQTLVFDAFVAGSGAFSGNTTLTNFANVRSDQVGTVQDSASVFVQVIPGSQSLSIVKTVMDVSTGGSFQKSVSANPGDRVRFQVVVNTFGNAVQTNVIARDILPVNLTYISGTLQQNGSGVGNDYDFFGGGKNLGSLSPNTTQTLVFDTTVAAAGAFSGATTLTNTANVRSDQVGTVQDSANVFVGVVLGTSFQIRKTAFNLTKGVDATTVPADPGDVISYTLYYKNTGQTTIQGAVIDDQISDIRELADVIDQGGAVHINGDIAYAPVDVPAGVEISRSFQVKIRDASLFPVNSDLVMTNVYGNTINVVVRRPQVLGAVTPPRTGANEWVAVGLAFFATLGFWFYRKYRRLALHP